MSIVLDVGVAGWVVADASDGEGDGVTVGLLQALTNNENTASMRNADFLSISTS
jgi:hypothetical protein